MEIAGVPKAVHGRLTGCGDHREAAVVDCIRRSWRRERDALRSWALCEGRRRRKQQCHESKRDQSNSNFKHSLVFPRKKFHAPD